MRAPFIRRSALLAFIALSQLMQPGSAGACVQPPANLIGWWPGENNANDISGSFSNGILQNGTAFGPGLVGQAFSFDGVDDQVLVPHNANQNVGAQLTIDAWVNPTSLGHGRTILQKRSASNVGGYVFETVGQPYGPDGGLQFVITIGGVFSSLGTPSGVLTLDTWQHVAATYDGATMKIFVNGVEQASLATTGTIDAVTDPIVIGRNVVIPADAWQGSIDEIELFDRALSPSEIQSIVDAGSAGTCKPPCVQPPANLVSWWPGDGNANDIQDGNNGTLSGAATFATGEVGQAFNFDGTSGSAIVADANSLDVTTQFTLDAWINPASLQSDSPHPGQGGIISKVGGPNGDHGYQFGLTGNNSELYCQFNAVGEAWPANQLLAAVPGAIPLNAWTHVACTYDNTNLTIYVNGVAVGTVLVGSKSVVDSASNLRISGDDNGNVFFDGRIDEAEVFNRALAQAEIQAIVDAASAGKCKSIATTTSTTISTTTSSSSTTTSTSAMPSTTSTSSTTSTTREPSTSTTRPPTVSTTTTEPVSTTTTLLTVLPPTACPDAQAAAAIEVAVEAQCSCEDATNHGAFVRCATEVARNAVKSGTLPKQCKGAVTTCAKHSTCGKPGFVTCCRTTSKGKTTCSTKSDAAHCKSPKHGSACVGQRPSCCDACVAGGCAAP